MEFWFQKHLLESNQCLTLKFWRSPSWRGFPWNVQTFGSFFYSVTKRQFMLCQKVRFSLNSISPACTVLWNQSISNKTPKRSILISLNCHLTSVLYYVLLMWPAMARSVPHFSTFSNSLNLKWKHTVPDCVFMLRHAWRIFGSESVAAEMMAIWLFADGEFHTNTHNALSLQRQICLLKNKTNE